MNAYVGTATSRVDGRAKVTGAAKYAGEFTADGLVHGFVVEATIPRGRIARLDTSEALKVTGVLDVLTHAHRPPLADKDEAWKDEVAPDEGSPFRPLYDDSIKFNGQPIALVVAEEWETAKFAATLVRVEYQQEQAFATDLEAGRNKATEVKKPHEPRGDAAGALAGSAVRHEADYFIPTEHHNPMELYATTVVWDGNGRLTVYDKTQGVLNVHKYLCSVFGKKPDEIRVLSPYVGGAFGSGLRPQYQVVLATLAALALKRSVRVVLTRQQMYGLGHRPATIERVGIGAKPDGTLEAVTHEATAITSRYEDFARNDSGWAEQLYKSRNSHYSHKLARLDVSTPCDMRAPGAASGVCALECAMDELALALNLDPIELRLKCYSDRDQSEDLPYTSKQLRECYARGAEAFGWSKRNPAARSMRDDKELVGWGMATGVWEALQMPVAVRIVLSANGHAEVSCAASDIGTGTYTIVAQVAADALGLPIENISVKLADSTLPQAPVEGGSWMAASSAHAVLGAAEDIRQELARLASAMPSSPLAGIDAAEVILVDGTIASNGEKSRAVPITDAMRYGKLERIEKHKLNHFAEDKSHARNTHSAVFAEVKIDEQLGVIRVTRVVSAVAAGRILNTKTGRSQIMGGVVWGIGMALHEETVMDHRFGRIMNANIAEYHFPVNADIHDIDVIFVEERDDRINRLGVKGLGEIGIVGVPAAIANAVYHATGKRIRRFPITLDKLLA
ncbi:xanthine dehydrogenase family protein molybdopterin-binding subunit [Bradyrhizobium diazoefficiens]|uniref:Dehydrogenase n=1 Tax=Bradyrhizobium diazoefficiens (strain JCM 10833 / BCRC 13528 / IAM 13628 / NBRC 14792 / USDA 110) TaxID=224911 RepID=Q89JR1_BRADU|nr:xanthine dehydrogenase family protein molybdopterin-binding subunit [Bradyrhizobium diazoefficiens]AND90410.1 aldehyde oxidase [Bradyrhizobium diazoefficiens USDA 110]PDT58373.1 dehydrogenase [Bradyrhizobium diazoefficiens]QBP23990.1 xanthine dehydrogenase family protein molybdopterin-binding subunit [Bradyrhizobium diazoefficiens]QLD43017.1 xanthine dehydrogenase family protein molybdopterin-binding subunit [Bradyrhizobium diazoefficiens]WLB35372.1 xanthine dehydrogenase family protein mol